ncbi:MAG TPA: phage baseplate assembly protein V [Candidatus Binatus sp.]|uniref:phage baseplate assembly protein V n=1 Tax=Candidatus Binatus sp. TaxID=2811406 RepID=UPI002B468A68|nr:phage baseplate assembly protein V [Candidatus Binatus sp.]HKN12981.1 phage baseplate assembly protein V [Candidatus Binatus sp.]
MNDIIEYRERFASLNPTFRVGIVQAQDTAHAKVRVVFPDYDEMISWWLPVVFFKTQDDKAYWIPDIGEQVVCLMDLRDEAGAVLGAIYSSADAPPVNSADKFYLGFKDGARFEYDRVAHLLDLLFQDTTELTCNAQSHLLDLKFQDQAELTYDGIQHALMVTLPEGAGFNLTANGAQIQIDSSGNVIIKSAGQVQLGNGLLAGVARLGDRVQVGEATGTIVTASTDVLAG